MDCLYTRGESNLMIQCANPKAQYIAFKDEIDAAIKKVLDGGNYILGEEVEEFEEEFASYICVSYGVGVGSGTEAIHLALKACEIGEGHEVITVSHTAVATVAAIELSGATPVLIDIEPDFFTLDPDSLEEAITPKTKAVIPVHLYGQPADLGPIMEIAQKHCLYVIEDCAQANGAIYEDKRAGSYGDISCFSFYPTKNLGAFGDGGMVISNDRELARKVRLLREYGWSERYVSHIPGWNSRLDEMQAAILRVKLRHLDEDNSKRKYLAEMYNRELDATELLLPKQRKNSTHVYHLYVVRTNHRDELLTFLREKGILASIHYPVPVHLQPAYKGIQGCDKLPETEKIAKKIISLPIYPGLSELDMQMIIKSINCFTGAVHD